MAHLFIQTLLSLLQTGTILYDLDKSYDKQQAHFEKEPNIIRQI
jgi:hypothetical protein